jgi:ribonuclease HII|tara:strand:- start:755 stop:1408 length:654 start_codon:yes stop_codon:yes gene_type:complete
MTAISRSIRKAPRDQEQASGIMQSVRVFAGVDEAGRGALAGAVVAAAVVLDPSTAIAGLRDSKKLTAGRREVLNQQIKERALYWSVGRAEVGEIDEINILQASLLAMKRAVEALTFPVEYVIVDGNRCPHLSCQVACLIKGDSILEAIMAASIIAKVSRDQEMVELDSRFPNYGLAKHKGYGTKAHLAAINEFGATDVHRKSFAPMKFRQGELAFDE